MGEGMVLRLQAARGATAGFWRQFPERAYALGLSSQSLGSATPGATGEERGSSLSVSLEQQ
jgi:hypothetical protein